MSLILLRARSCGAAVITGTAQSEENSLLDNRATHPLTEGYFEEGKLSPGALIPYFPPWPYLILAFYYKSITCYIAPISRTPHHLATAG